MTKWRRRTVLAALAGGVGVLAGTAPRAHADATLQADLSIREYSVIYGAVDRVQLRITNQRERESIQPVVLGWAQGRQSLLPWDRVAGEVPVPAGATHDLVLAAPGDAGDDHLRFVVDQPGVLRVFDEGTEQRADVKWTPEANIKGGE